LVIGVAQHCIGAIATVGMIDGMALLGEGGNHRGGNRGLILYDQYPHDASDNGMDYSDDPAFTERRHTGIFPDFPTATGPAAQ
jgi:hypothetical protein